MPTVSNLPRTCLLLGIAILVMVMTIPLHAQEPLPTDGAPGIELLSTDQEPAPAVADAATPEPTASEDDWDPRYAISTRYSKSQSGKTITWYLMYSKAAEIVEHLNGIFGESGVRITALDQTNAILLQTDDPKSEMLQEVIDVVRSLDIRPGQVLIDVLVVETTISDKDIFDLEFKQLLRDPLGLKQTMSTLAGDFGAIEERNPASPRQGLKAFAISNNKIKVLVNALKEKANTEVVSSPHIITRNNQEATFQVGQTITILDSVTPTESGATKTYINKDVVTKLVVKPHINRSGQVRLDVDQKMDEVLEHDFANGTASIQNRKIKTTAFLENGETLILGGFIGDTTHDDDRRLPWVSRLPLIGQAFKSKDNRREKKELLVFITPYILHTAEEEQRLMAHKTAKLSSKDKIRSLLANLQMKKRADPKETYLIKRGSRNWLYDFGTKHITELCWDVPEAIKPRDLTLTRAGGCPFAFGQPKSLKPPEFRTLLEPSEGFAFQKEFFVQDPQAYQKVVLKVASKNAAVVYLNGVLIDEDPMMKLVDGHDYDYWNRFREDVPLGALRKGKNTLIALLGNDKTTSGAYFDLELEAMLK